MGYEFRIVDLTNYYNWVQLPQYVEEKFRKGLIPPALFSDLLRLALLKQYGGVWMLPCIAQVLAMRSCESDGSRSWVAN